MQLIYLRIFVKIVMGTVMKGFDTNCYIIKVLNTLIMSVDELRVVGFQACLFTDFVVGYNKEKGKEVA